MRRTRAAVIILAGSFLLFAGQSPAQAQKRTDASERSARPLTLAERQAAWSANKAEYRRRLVRDGQASADRWLDQQARPQTSEQRPPRQTAEQRSGTTTHTGKKNCKKVRWVNRATSGFGGGPMTMSRVAVCAD